MNTKDWVSFEFRTHILSTVRELDIDTNIIDSLIEDLINRIENKLKTVGVNNESDYYIYELIEIAKSIVNDCYLSSDDSRSFKIFEYFPKDDLVILLKPKHTIMLVVSIKEMAEHNNISHDLDKFINKLSKTLMVHTEEVTKTLNLMGYDKSISKNKVTNIYNNR